MEELFAIEYFMRTAQREAHYGYEKNEVRIAVVIVLNNKIIAQAYNLTEHNEIQSITSAANYLDGKYLQECTLYVTMEPCIMCAGALYWSQIGKIVIGARDTQRGYINAGIKLHPKTSVELNVLENECSTLVKQFFQSKR